VITNQLSKIVLLYACETSVCVLHHLCVDVGYVDGIFLNRRSSIIRDFLRIVILSLWNTSQRDFQFLCEPARTSWTFICGTVLFSGSSRRGEGRDRLKR